MFITNECRNTDQIYSNQRSLAFVVVLIAGIVGGLLVVFSILLLCKCRINRKNLREAEQVKLLYETLNRATVFDASRFYQYGNKEFSRLEPRRSNPLDHYQLSETQQEISTSKPVISDYHLSIGESAYNQSYHDNREANNLLDNKQHDSHIYGNLFNDDQPAEQYLQVDPRCYVRQKSNISMIVPRKSEALRLEKGHSINVDTRPSPTPSSLSPYRQSSFDVALARCSPNEQSFSTVISPQQECYFTPRGSSLSVIGNISTGTPPGSQHLSPPISHSSRQNSVTEKKDLTVTLNVSGRGSSSRLSIVQREHEHSRSLEHSIPANNMTIDKQSRSFDAVHLGIHRDGPGGNRRAKSYECAEEGLSAVIAPLPIVIKIPDMRELVQAAQFQLNSNHRSTLARQIIINNQTNEGLTVDDLWRLHQAYEYEEQQQFDGTSPDDLSPDLFTSTSIDSAGAMAIHQVSKGEKNIPLEEDPSKYDYRRKSSSNLLLPPPEVRRQALRRTFEKRRRCINQSNAKREEQSSNSQTGFDDDYEHSHQSSTMKSTDFSSLLNNFNSKSANSSFDRSLETDFDMQSNTSSREPNDYFTSIESSTNENTLPEIIQRLHINQDDSGYKSLESQNSPNHTFSLDWMSADGVESVIYIDQTPKQKEISRQREEVHRSSPNFQQVYSEISSTLNLPNSVSLKPNSSSNTLLTSTSFNRTASKKRREFGKDKRHAASNIGLPHVITADERQFSSPMVHQVNEVKTSSSTLKVRHPDVARSKSEEVQLLDFPANQLIFRSNESINTRIQPSSSATDVLQFSPNPIGVNQDEHSCPTFQRSPSSATSPTAISPQIVAFRSKRGSISFDTPGFSLRSPTPNTTKTSPASSALWTKPRLKFSMVRDTTTSSLGSTFPSYSMALANDLTIDENTNRIINEFLLEDRNKNLHSEQIRQQTFDETMRMNNHHQTPKATSQQSRTVLIKEHQQTQKRISPELQNHSQSLRTTIQRDNDIVVSFPSIIVTGYESSN